MKKMLLRINSELFLMAGVVEKTVSSGDALLVRLRYQEYGKPAFTDIFYRDQKKRDDGKTPIPFASLARSLNLSRGEAVITAVRFPGNDNGTANGYGIRRDGILAFHNEKESRAMICGIVLAAFPSRYETGLRVLAGKDRNGEPAFVTLLCETPKLIRTAEALTPHDGVYKRMTAVCGRPFTDFKEDGRHTSYVANDITECGTCVKKEKQKIR